MMTLSERLFQAIEAIPVSTVTKAETREVAELQTQFPEVATVLKEMVSEAKVTNSLDPKQDKTALMVAVDKGRHDLVWLLLQSHVDVNATNTQGATALFFAKDAEMVFILLAFKANLDVEDINHVNPLRHAVYHHSVQVVMALLHEGNFANEAARYNYANTFDINVNVPPLGWLMIFRHQTQQPLHKVMALCEAGANYDSYLSEGPSCLGLSIRESYPEAFAFFLGRNPNRTLFTKNSPRDREAFFKAAQNGDVPIIDVFHQHLMKHWPGKATLNDLGFINDKIPVTLLMLAANNNRTELVRYLLQKEVDPFRKNELGGHVFFYVASLGLTAILRLLLNHCAAQPEDLRTILNDWVIDGGKKVTTLMVAAKHGHADVVRLLLQYSADPFMQDEADGHVFYYTAYEGKAEVMEVLLAAVPARSARLQELLETPVEHGPMWGIGDGKMYNNTLVVATLRDRSSKIRPMLIASGMELDSVALRCFYETSRRSREVEITTFLEPLIQQKDARKPRLIQVYKDAIQAGMSRSQRGKRLQSSAIAESDMPESAMQELKEFSPNLNQKTESEQKKSEAPTVRNAEPTSESILALLELNRITSSRSSMTLDAMDEMGGICDFVEACQELLTKSLHKVDTEVLSALLVAVIDYEFWKEDVISEHGEFPLSQQLITKLINERRHDVLIYCNEKTTSALHSAERTARLDLVKSILIAPYTQLKAGDAHGNPAELGRNSKEITTYLAAQKDRATLFDYWWWRKETRKTDPNSEALKRHTRIGRQLWNYLEQGEFAAALAFIKQAIEDRPFFSRFKTEEKILEGLISIPNASSLTKDALKAQQIAQLESLYKEFEPFWHRPLPMRVVAAQIHITEERVDTAEEKVEASSDNAFWHIPLPTSVVVAQVDRARTEVTAISARIAGQIAVQSGSMQTQSTSRLASMPYVLGSLAVSTSSSAVSSSAESNVSKALVFTPSP